MIEEALKRLKELASRGPIKAHSSGSNEVGKTMQRALGITHSTSTSNHFMGFTITSTTNKGQGKTKLFSKVGDWGQSAVSSTREIVELFGEEDTSGKYRRQLFCTVDAIEPNTFGLFLKVDTTKGVVSEYYSSGITEQPVLTWDSEELSRELAARDNFIILTASRYKKPDGNYYHYTNAEFFIGANFSGFLKQIELGGITVDHLISVGQDGRTTEKGPAFKITRNARQELYSNYKKYDLLD